MLLRKFPTCFLLCTLIFIPTSTEALSMLDLRKLISTYSRTYAAGSPINTSDPSFMDSGDLNNTEEDNEGNCFNEGELAANLQRCDVTTPYRNHDGTCNNLMFPTWGSVGDCYTRFLNASYQGKSGIRKSVTGGELPLAREIVLKIFVDRKYPSLNTTFLFTVFGQAVAHELTLSDSQNVNGSCCSPENAKITSKCAPIYYPPDDPTFSKFNVTCQDFERSAECPNCHNKKRQQSNVVTASIDAHITYGTSEEMAKSLRANDGTGKMLVENTKCGELPPFSKTPKPGFKAGDLRANQHATLTTLQVLFVKLHNMIAEELRMLNPSWNGETLYQQARKIVGAIFQNIVYSEYLVVLLGKAHMDYYNLAVQKESQQPSPSYPYAPPKNNQGGTQYKPTVRLGIWNEFAAASFRLHTMVPNKVGLRQLQFSDYFDNPGRIRRCQMDGILKGTCTAPSENYDRYFIDYLTNHFSQKLNESHGTDLISTHIQRGRDHGVPSYCSMLNYLTNGKINPKKFEDLSLIISKDNIYLLKATYKHVCDIDLFVGMNLEIRVTKANLGPTACAIASLQFNYVKFGDRFYFEHLNLPTSFTSDQRNSLRNITLARILCDNTGIEYIQKNPFLLESPDNPAVSCCTIPYMDLTPWKEYP